MNAVPDPDIFFELDAKKHRALGQAYQDALRNVGTQLQIKARNAHVLREKATYVTIPVTNIRVPGYDFHQCYNYVKQSLEEQGYRVCSEWGDRPSPRVWVSWANIVPRFVRESIRNARGIEVSATGEFIEPPPPEMPTGPIVPPRQTASDAYLRFGNPSIPACPYNPEELDAIQQLHQSKISKRI